jgi:hypothetical protein
MSMGDGRVIRGWAWFVGSIGLVGSGVLATGCPVDRDWTTSWVWTGETGRWDPDFPGPVALSRVGLACSVDGAFIRFTAETAGWSSGMVFSEETGASEPHRADEHDLFSFDFDWDGAWERLDQVVDAAGTLADPLSDWDRNASSLFDCPEVLDVARMTYAFAVWDTDDQFADCLVFGHDPAALTDGTALRSLDPDFDASSCRVGVLAE